MSDDNPLIGPASGYDFSEYDGPPKKETEEAVYGEKLPFNHLVVDTALEAVEAATNRALEHGQFMVAVWSVDQEGRVRLETRTTWQFPRIAEGTAIELLREDLANIQRPEPLPRSKRFVLQKPEEKP